MSERPGDPNLPVETREERRARIAAAQREVSKKPKPSEGGPSPLAVASEVAVQRSIYDEMPEVSLRTDGGRTIPEHLVPGRWVTVTTMGGLTLVARITSTGEHELILEAEGLPPTVARWGDVAAFEGTPSRKFQLEQAERIAAARPDPALARRDRQKDRRKRPARAEDEARDAEQRPNPLRPGAEDQRQFDAPRAEVLGQGADDDDDDDDGHGDAARA